jgi:hypothetical protein
MMGKTLTKDQIHGGNDPFGIWTNEKRSLDDIREKAWKISTISHSALSK